MESKHAYYNNVPTLYYYLFDIKKREVGTYLGFSKSFVHEKMKNNWIFREAQKDK